MPVAILLLHLLRIFGLGHLALRGATRIFGEPHDQTARVGTALALGLGLNHLILLCGASLATSFYVTFALALFEIGLLTYPHLRKRSWPHLERRSSFIFVAVVFILVGLKALSVANEGWDGRMIWFFAAKGIFHEGTLWAKSTFLYNPYEWASFDYPKLGPGLAAQVAWTFGYWNEFLPRLSLPLLLVPSLTSLMSFRPPIRNRQPWTQVFSDVAQIAFWAFVALTLLRPGMWLWNGFMDVFLALNALVATLLAARYLSLRKGGDLLAAAALLALCGSLKNEGILMTLAIGVVFIAFAAKLKVSVYVPRLLFLLVVFVPVGLWQFLKKSWGLSNNLHLGASSVSIIATRLTNPNELGLILDQMLNSNRLLRGFAVIFFVSWLIRRYTRKMEPPGTSSRLPTIEETCVFWFPLAASFVYFAGLYVVYVATPYPLAWHLENSVDRTTLWPMIAVFWLAYASVKGWEDEPAHTLRPHRKVDVT